VSAREPLTEQEREAFRKAIVEGNAAGALGEHCWLTARDFYRDAEPRELERRLRASLERFGRHSENCPARAGLHATTPQRCTCGFHEALQAIPAESDDRATPQDIEQEALEAAAEAYHERVRAVYTRITGYGLQGLHVEQQAPIAESVRATSAEAQLAEALAALKRIAAGPNSEPFAEPWSIAEAKIALARIARIQSGEEAR
jgi:hypothetical protein